ncbi:MAG: tRNA pseudouridine(55) synthase TruB [Ignavibacteriota bacterium]
MGSETSLGPPTLSYGDFVRDPMMIIPTLNSESGALLLVDKPYGITSFAMVYRIRRILTQYCGDKKVKVGHGGTLDPLATGLLILGTRKATRSLTNLLGLEKTYWCELRLGITSPSFDLETPIQILEIPEGLTADKIKNKLLSFLGPQLQRPPIFSAIKLKGKPMYKHARKGRDIVMPEKSITIYSIDGIEVDLPFVRFRVECSKGTYIRSLVSDLGKTLGTGAVLINLRREKIGDWSVADSLTSELITVLENQDLRIGQPAIEQLTEVINL